MCKRMICCVFFRCISIIYYLANLSAPNIAQRIQLKCWRIRPAFANLIRHKQSYHHFLLDSLSFACMWIKHVHFISSLSLSLALSRSTGSQHAKMLLLLSIFILRMAKYSCDVQRFDLWAENVHTLAEWITSYMN